MRNRILLALCILAFGIAWAQDSGSDGESTAQSAYDIFGLSPDDTGGETGGEAVVADSGQAESEPEPAEATVAEVEAPEASVSEIAPVTAVPEPSAEAGEAEEVLMAEIMRLLAERDSLYEELNELRAENLTLAQAADEAEYYKLRSGELEAELERLETELAAKEAELADAGARLTDIEAQLAEEGVRLADAEARLALVEQGDDALGAALIEKDALLAEKDASLAEKEALLSEKDASLAEKDASIADKDARLVELDASIVELNARVESLESSLAEAEAELADAKLALADADAVDQPEAVETVEPVVTTGTDETVAALEKRVAELSAERDAAIATRDAAIATRDASDTMRLATERLLEETRAELERALADAKEAGSIVSAPVPAPAATAGTGAGGYLSGWAIDSSRFTKALRSGFDGSASRLGAWRISGETASQSDPKQYFSRLEMPLAQGKAATLYRFKARSTGDGWVGVGLHLYVEDVKKRRGYGEGRSLLVWFTRDRAARGDDATYLQLYRSDDDVVMERMFDAELSDGIERWRSVEVLYDPSAEFIAVSVDGVLRVVYKTFFGRDSGATVSLRTLGAGGSFSDFSAWSE